MPRRTVGKADQLMRNAASMPVFDRIVIDQIDPERLVPGGTDTCIHDLIKYSTTTSIAIIGIGSDKSVGKWREIDFGSKRIWFLPVARVDRMKRRRVPHSLRMALGILRYRRLIPAGTLQAHRVEIGAVLAALRPTKLIQFIHNDSHGLTGANSDSVWKRLPWLYRVLERSVFRSAGEVVLFNRTDAERIRGLFPNAVIAQTWFDPDVFHESGMHREESDLVKVCFIGRLEAQKDPLLAIESIAELNALTPALLVVVGSGQLGAEMKRRAANLGIADKVRFVGPVARREVAQIMADCDVMLMTSHYEGSPRVLAEAGATGLPVVATREADTDSALTGENGLRIDSRDPRQLADALLQAISFDPADCARGVSHRSAPHAIAALLHE